MSKSDKKFFPMFEVLLFPTLKCNLNCDYCYVYEWRKQRELRRRGKEMSLETAKKAIDLLYANRGGNKKLSIWLFGGEPTVHSRFKEFVEGVLKYAEGQYGDVNWSIGMTTNGVRMSNEKFAKFVAERFGTLTISLDGVREHHDKHRKFPSGEGSWKYVVKAIKNLATLMRKGEAKTNFVQIHITYSPDTVRYFKDDVVFVDKLTDGINSDIATEFVYEADWKDEHYRMLEKQLELTLEYALDVLYNEDRVLRWNLLMRVAQILFGMPPPNNQRCGLGQGVVAVAPDGYIYQCQRAVQKLPPIGHVDEGFYERRYQLWETFDRIKIKDRLNCWRCPFHLICAAGCILVNWEVNKDFYTPPRSLCKISKIVAKVLPSYYMCAKASAKEEIVVEYLRKNRLRTGKPLCP